MSDDLSFYETAAQVVPLLFVVLVFEFRALASEVQTHSISWFGTARHATRRSTDAVLHVASSVLLLLLLAIGEATALEVLMSEDPSPKKGEVVAAALFGGGLVVVLGILEALASPLLKGRNFRVVTNGLLVAAIAAWLLAA
jgi:hypothetical protein